jgi:ryanodine receptor 2
MITDNGPLPGLLPNHKQSVLLFLDRVYGIDSQEMLFQFLEQSYLPDLRGATMMDSVRILLYLPLCKIIISTV